ncbi:MAG TPA: hypothetical protein PKC70_16450, partial [Cellvibrionaceae bacterium]|nr:hypothetical protein [Cellvibrionaceae bacterium]
CCCLCVAIVVVLSLLLLLLLRSHTHTHTHTHLSHGAVDAPAAAHLTKVQHTGLNHRGEASDHFLIPVISVFAEITGRFDLRQVKTLY